MSATKTNYIDKTPAQKACLDVVRWWTGLPWHLRQALVEDASRRCGALPGSFPIIETVKRAIGESQ